MKKLLTVFIILFYLLIYHTEIILIGKIIQKLKSLVKIRTKKLCSTFMQPAVCTVKK